MRRQKTLSAPQPPPLARSPPQRSTTRILHFRPSLRSECYFEAGCMNSTQCMYSSLVPAAFSALRLLVFQSAMANWGDVEMPVAQQQSWTLQQ